MTFNDHKGSRYPVPALAQTTVRHDRLSSTLNVTLRDNGDALIPTRAGASCSNCAWNVTLCDKMDLSPGRDTSGSVTNRFVICSCRKDVDFGARRTRGSIEKCLVASCHVASLGKNQAPVV